MTAIAEFRISRKVKKALFDNPLQGQAGDVIRRLRYICREECGDLFSICAAAGITQWEIEALDVGHHYVNPFDTPTDTIGWYISAVLLRIGAKPEEIFGKYFPANQMRRHLRWHKVYLPGFHKETKRILTALAEVELLLQYATKEKKTLHKVHARHHHELKSSHKLLKYIWVDRMELSIYAGLLTHNNERGLIKFANPRVIQGKAETEKVKAICSGCGSMQLFPTNKLFRKVDGVKSCNACRLKAMYEKKKFYFIVDVRTGYKYWNFAAAYHRLGVGKGENKLSLRQFIARLKEEKVMLVGDVYIWLKKREVKQMRNTERLKLIELGMPPGFQVPIRHLSMAQGLKRRTELKRREREKRKRAALRRKRLWLEKLVTRQDIADYRSYMIERGKQIRQRVLDADTLEK